MTVLKVLVHTRLRTLILHSLHAVVYRQLIITSNIVFACASQQRKCSGQ